MAEYFFSLSDSDRKEALEQVGAKTGRPAHLLEKDIWVVWALRALFDSWPDSNFTFKGGTSLSKVYKIIDRFSEDLDLTYDIRHLIPDQVGANPESPPNRSQADRWTKAVRQRLPEWIASTVKPRPEDELMVGDALAFDDLMAACAEIEAKINIFQAR